MEEEEEVVVVDLLQEFVNLLQELEVHEREKLEIYFLLLLLLLCGEFVIPP